MTATPITSYYDNPIKNFEFLKSLSSNEIEIYSLGYIAACYHIREAMSDSSTTLLEAALETELDEEKAYFLKFVRLLDTFDKSLEGRITLLQHKFPDLFNE